MRQGSSRKQTTSRACRARLERVQLLDSAATRGATHAMSGRRAMDCTVKQASAGQDSDCPLSCIAQPGLRSDPLLTGAPTVRAIHCLLAYATLQPRHSNRPHGLQDEAKTSEAQLTARDYVCSCSADSILVLIADDPRPGVVSLRSRCAGYGYLLVVGAIAVRMSRARDVCALLFRWGRIRIKELRHGKVWQRKTASYMAGGGYNALGALATL